MEPRKSFPEQLKEAYAKPYTLPDVRKMSFGPFIELTNHDDGDIALINLDTVEFITCGTESGTVLVTNNGRGKYGEDRYYHVRESYEKVKQLIRRTKSSPQFRCNMGFSEKALSIICDQLCRYPRECKDEDELEARCEHCPLIELEDEFCE